MIVQELINTAVQAAVVFLIAAVFYLFAGKTRGNFLRFIGVYPPISKAMLWALILSCVIVPATIALFFFEPLRSVATADNTIAGDIREHGWNAETLVLILILAFLKTSFTEEVLFRGILAKRFIAWIGFATGNTLHALIFGAIHLLIFVVPGGPEFSWGPALAVFGIPAVIGWLLVFLNEKAGNGSIVPGWFVHGIGNALAYPALAFL